MTTNTYHANKDVSVQAEVYKLTTPQVPGTVVSGRNHYLVRKGGARVEIQVGDFIIRGDDGQVDAMPPALFNQLFTIDADEVKAKAVAAKEAEAAVAAETEAQAEADAEAEAAADAAEVVIEESVDSELNIFELPDDDNVPPEPEPDPEPEPEPAKKKAKRKRKKKT